MNIKQAKWILKTALRLLEEWEQKPMYENYWHDLISVCQVTYKNTKENAFARNVLLNIMSALENDRGREDN